MARFAWIVLLIACAPPRIAEQTEAVSVGAERDFIATPLDIADGEQTLRALHATSTGYVALWSDTREGDWIEAAEDGSRLRGYLARVGRDGNVLDPTGVPFEPPGLFPNYAISSACSDDGVCLIVAASTFSEVATVLVSGDHVMVATRTALGSYAGFAVAWDGTAFHIAWHPFFSGTSPPTMRTAEMLADGSLGPVHDLARGLVTGLACRGPDCLVTYQDGFGLQVPTRGQIFDATGAGPTFQIVAGGVRQNSTPVSDGTRYWLAIILQPDELSFANSSVRVFRIAPNGGVLDPAGIEVVAPSPTEENLKPLIASDGVNAVVAWTRRVSTTLTGHIARISPTGSVLDPGGGVMVNPHNGVWGLACHAGQCLTAWSTQSPDIMVGGARFAGSTKLDPDDMVIATSQPGQVWSRLAFGHGAYAAAWRDTRRSAQDPGVVPLRAAVFTAEGTPREIVLRSGGTCFAAGPPSVTATATAYAVAWWEGCPGGANVYLQLFDPAAQPIAPVISVDASGVSPMVASSGASMLVTWDAQNGDILASRYTETGTLLTPSKVAVANGFEPVVAFDGADHYLLTYRRRLDPSRFVISLLVRRLAVDGSVGPERLLSLPDTDAESASLACTGGTCLAAFRENHAQVRAMWILPDGTTSATTLFGAGARSIAVAFDGVAFVVAWSSATGIHGARLALDGSVLENDIALAAPATNPARPALASDGTGKLVLLYDRFDPDPAFRSRRLRSRTMDAEGITPPDAGVPDAASLPDAPLDGAILPDAAVDAPPDAVDAPPDAVDAPPDAVDAPPDAVVDAAPDAAVDATIDAPPDAAIDAAVDAPPDAVDAPPDAAVDAPPDTPAPDDAAIPAPPSPDDRADGCCSARGNDRFTWVLLVVLVALVVRRRGSTGRVRSWPG